MTNDEIIQLAKESGFNFRSHEEGAGIWFTDTRGNRWFVHMWPQLTKFAELIQAKAVPEPPMRPPSLDWGLLSEEPHPTKYTDPNSKQEVTISVSALAKMAAEIDDLKSQLDKLTQARAWQPIETAPKDGTPIITYGTRCLHVAWWDIVDGGGHPENGPALYWWVSETTEFIDGKYDMPTLWIPLPTPPAAQKGSV